jgi:hypothetical protein
MMFVEIESERVFFAGTRVRLAAKDDRGLNDEL